MSESQRRDGSRLEVDDPFFCKKCGEKIKGGSLITETDDVPTGFIFGEDSNGNTGRVVLEKCRDCWVADKIEEIKCDAEMRYATKDRD